MTTNELPLAAAEAAAAPVRYDRVTIAFHWLTALSVVLLFGAAYWWNALPRIAPLREGLQAFHVSVGILFAAAFVGRILWRWTGGRRLDAAEHGLAGLAAHAVHAALYVLLGVQIILGFLLRWAEGEEFFFFGLFAIPQVGMPDRAMSRLHEALHNAVGWTIVYLAAAHALAALAHHYVLKDGVLRRMLPAARD